MEKEILAIENYQSYSYKELAVMLNTNTSKIKRTFNNLGIIKIKKLVISKNVNISLIQDQIILGTIMGDGTISKHFKCIKTNKQHNSQIRIKHSIKQLDYLKYKKELLGDLSLDIHIDIQKNGGFGGDNYEYCYVNLIKCKEMNIYRDIWYPKNRKSLSKDIERIEGLGLAIWFMDDGSWHGSSIKLSTMWFTLKELNYLKRILYDKFDLDFSICADRTLYLRKKSLLKFYMLIKPYLLESMAYKIAPARGKLDELLENQEIDNQQRSFDGNTKNVQRLTKVTLTDKADGKIDTSVQHKQIMFMMI